LVAAHPESAAARLLWADAEATEGSAAVAMVQYRKALEIDQRDVTALNNLAYLLTNTNRADEALKYAQQAKELAPDSPEVDDTLGWTYFHKGIYTLAVTHLESATAREGTARRKYHLGLAYLKAGDEKRGKQVLEAALKMDPKLPEAKAAQEALAGSAQ
jgi:Tfp pilus assembly protein PilF